MVLLTFYYMFATGVQAWRLRSISQKIAKILDNKHSVAFCTKSDDTSQGMPSALITSDLCENASEATVDSCFWSNDISQGLCIKPPQKLLMGAFITFPPSPSSIPFKFACVAGSSLSKEIIYALVETDLHPTGNQQSVAVELEVFGRLVAWKVDTRLAIVLETDARKFSQLILSTFVHNTNLVNDHLPLVRVQTVTIEGVPQDFEQIRKHSRKDTISRAAGGGQLSADEWESHLDGIKNLSVLAGQAREFEYKKNLTEGKTGIYHAQPDLIASSQNMSQHHASTPGTPKKTVGVLDSLEKTEEKLEALKAQFKRQEEEDKHKHPPKLASLVGRPPFVSQDSLDTPETPHFPTISPSHSVASGLGVPEAPKFPISPSMERKIKHHHKARTVMEDDDEEDGRPHEKKEIIEEPTIHNLPVKNITADFLEIERENYETKVDSATRPIIKILKPIPPPIVTIQEPIAELDQAPPKVSSKASIKRKRQNLKGAKPPNILVYSESITTRDNVIKTMGNILKRNVYTIYPLNDQQVRSRIWMDNATLLVVCGSVIGSEIGSIFLDFFLRGGKVLCLCSDLLRNVLPTYHTAEVREHELVQFSYGKWKNIKMMHHIFCYQPSPVRKNFSQESDDPPKERTAAENPSVELKDQYGVLHNVKVQTLGTEDTWKTPSLLMVYTDNGGKIVFSQIHLEVDPSLYENDEQKYEILMKNDGLRYEIFSDVLNTHLGIVVKGGDEAPAVYTCGYFLGKHDLKSEMLEQLKPLMEADGNTLKLDGLTIKFCDKNDDAPEPDATFMPIKVHSCPDDFSTLDYFDTLNTEKIGRLLVYARTMTNSMTLVNDVKYTHGYAIIPRELRSAVGRGSNMWLCPSGCLMFSLQLHIPLDSPLGRRIPLVQHLVAVAIVSSIKKEPEYENLDIAVKWPNDIYADSTVKIGGLIINSLLEGNIAICNIGVGLNLSNSTPTTCINDMIAAYNKKHNANLPLLTYERALALIFNEIESILDRVHIEDGVDSLVEMYYKYWLHTDSPITVLTTDGTEKRAKIIGIDDFGFLQIKLNETHKIEVVHPDGNSFDMLRGLIIPKSN